jgi:hypothetical protein
MPCCAVLCPYQVVMPLDKKKVEPSNATLVEVGPRCALRPIKIFEGSFGGRVLYDNPVSVMGVSCVWGREAGSWCVSGVVCVC